MPKVVQGCKKNTRHHLCFHATLEDVFQGRLYCKQSEERTSPVQREQVDFPGSQRQESDGNRCSNHKAFYADVFFLLVGSNFILGQYKLYCVSQHCSVIGYLFFYSLSSFYLFSLLLGHDLYFVTALLCNYCVIIYSGKDIPSEFCFICLTSAPCAVEQADTVTPFRFSFPTLYY